MTTQQKFLTASELVERWNNAVTTGTLSNWRGKRKGPPFVKFGANVRYPLDKVIEWEKQRAVNDNGAESEGGEID